MSDLNYIKSYLVKLGVDVSSSDITKWDNSLKHLEGSFSATAENLEKDDEKVRKSFTATMKSLVKGYTKIATGFISAGIGIGKFMESITNSDMEMQKFARSMYLSVDQAKALQNTLGAMDLSIGDLRDVAYNPELLARYKEFLSLARSFKTTPEMKQSFKEIRAIFSEFQKFNLIFQSFKERLTHFIYQTVKVPARKLWEFLSNFNSKFAKNISNWAEKLGLIIGNILRLGLRVYEVISSIISAIGKVWDKLSGLSKGVIAAIFLINRIVKGSPIWRLMTMFTGVMMLIDDYKTYKEGGVSANALKPLWEKIEDQRNRPDSVYNQLITVLEQGLIPAINKLIDMLQKLFGWLYDLGAGIGEKIAGIRIAAGKYSDYVQNVGMGNAILNAVSGGTLGVSQEEYEKSKKSGGLELINPQEEDLYDFSENRVEKASESNKSYRVKPQPTPSVSQLLNSKQDVNQNFYFNLPPNAMETPQSFWDDVSTLIRNNKGVLVGEE